jgi:hypothetical protein
LVVLEREDAAGTVDVHDRIPRWILDQSRRLVAGDGREDGSLGIRRGRAGIARSTGADRGRDLRFVRAADVVDDLDGLAEVFNRHPVEVAQNRPLPPCANDAAARIDTGRSQSNERLAREMANGPACVGAPDDKKPDRRIREDIGDQALNAEVLGLERPHHGDLGWGIVGQMAREHLVRERADSDRCRIAERRIASWQRWPALPRLHGRRGVARGRPAQQQ